MRILAVDFGQRRIGIAVCDPSGLVVTPLTVIGSIGPNRDAQRILELARRHEAERILVGVPCSVGETPSAQARLAQAFAERLARAGAIPVETWDETLTTVDAEERMLATGASAKKRRAQRDAVAAAVLLESYLEHLRTTLRRP